MDISQTEAPGVRGEEVGADIAEGPRLLEVRGPSLHNESRDPAPLVRALVDRVVLRDKRIARPGVGEGPEPSAAELALEAPWPPLQGPPDHDVTPTLAF
jgi:hypothetical protein